MPDTPLITVPGIYPNIPEDAYHGREICPAPSISSSGLRKIIPPTESWRDPASPLHYWTWSPMNPKPPERTPESAALKIGKLAHLWVLEGKRFMERYEVITDDLNLNTKEARAIKEQAAETGREVIREKDLVAVRAMKDALLASCAAPLFKGARTEMTVAWKDAETDVWLRVRFDALPPAPRLILPDYKTADNASPARFMRAVGDYAYHMQAALYMDAIAAVTRDVPQSWIFVVQEKKPPYAVTVCQLDPIAIEWGRHLNRRAIRLFADCLAADRWPAYADKPVMVGLPYWTEKELQKQHEAGVFSGEWQAPHHQQPQEDAA